MGLDVDYIAAKQAIENLEKILCSMQHGEREQIADDIIEFADKIREKHRTKREKNTEQSESNKINPLSHEESLIEIFKQDMILELRKNMYKGSILDFKDFNAIITELEYHKAKLFLAIRVKNKGAIREYIADTANFLLMIGNLFEIYDVPNNKDECFEINRDVELFKKIKVVESSSGQIIGT